MLKITKKDFPWIVIIEDKISNNTGKVYQKISVGYSGKNPNATCDDDKYITKWFDFFNEQDLLKGATTFEYAYQRLKAEREAEKATEKNNKQMEKKETSNNSDVENDFEL